MREIAWRAGPDRATSPFPIYPAEAASLLPPAWLAGRIALVGVVLPGIDRHPTPVTRLSAEPEMPGVLVHAHALAQLLDDRDARLPPRLVEPMVTLAAAGIGLGLAMLGLPWPALLLAGAAAILGWGAVLVAGFRFGLPLLPFVAPALALLLTALLGASRLGRTERAERRRVRTAFERYLAPSVVARMLRGPGALRLGSERQHVSVLFTDLAGFSALTEKLGPERLAEALNPYLDGVLGIVEAHAGTVDKIVGDAVHAFFGAPEPQPDHAARAIACALAIDVFAQAHAARARAAGVPLGTTRIGVATGPAVVGNFGGSQRFDYTVYGDVINTAARLESANRQFGTRLCATAQVVAEAGVTGWRPVGTVGLAGKGLSVEILTPPEGDAAAYALAFERLAAGDTDAARTALLDLLAQQPEDGLGRFHLARIDRGESGIVLRLTQK
jgi:class 3 adenylate cyclase